VPKDHEVVEEEEKKKECSQILCLTLRVFWSQQECSQFFVIDSWR
jgi:hypothetical protein